MSLSPRCPLECPLYFSAGSGVSEFRDAKSGQENERLKKRREIWRRKRVDTKKTVKKSRQVLYFLRLGASPEIARRGITGIIRGPVTAGQNTR